MRRGNPRHGRHLAVVTAAGAAVALISGQPAQSAEEQAPKPDPLTLSRAGVKVRATVGGYCLPVQNDPTEFAECVDSVYPLPIRRKLPVRAGSRITLRTKSPARRLRVRLLRVRGQDFNRVAGKVRTRAVGESGKTWRLRLPRRLGRATALDLNVDYRPTGTARFGGTANFWAGIAKASCRR